MTLLIIRTHDLSTDEIIDSNMSQKDYLELIKENEKAKKIALENANAKAALLEKLGITEEEAKLLLS